RGVRSSCPRRYAARSLDCSPQQAIAAGDAVTILTPCSRSTLRFAPVMGYRFRVHVRIPIPTDSTQRRRGAETQRKGASDFYGRGRRVKTPSKKRRERPTADAPTRLILSVLFCRRAYAPQASSVLQR